MSDNIPAYLRKIEAEISRLKYGTNPASLYEPLRYIMKLGGKRLRPMLTVLSYSMYKKDISPIVPLAVAVETFHNFTLLHDDIMDQAPLRRGKPTVHKKWNVSTAILAGDVMQIKVYEMLLAIGDDKLKESLRAFNDCATQICEGQQRDMEFELKARVSEADYLTMIRQKTAVLLGFSLQLGAILGDADDNDKKFLYEFGVHMGMGFQLMDDLLDVYADKAKFGKQVGGDIISNKKTFLLIHALRKAKRKDKIELTHWLNLKKFDRRKKVRAVTGIYDRLQIRYIAEDRIKRYFDLAFKALDNISAETHNRDMLKNFALSLIERQA